MTYALRTLACGLALCFAASVEASPMLTAWHTFYDETDGASWTDCSGNRETPCDCWDPATFNDRVADAAYARVKCNGAETVINWFVIVKNNLVGTLTDNMIDLLVAQGLTFIDLTENEAGLNTEQCIDEDFDDGDYAGFHLCTPEPSASPTVTKFPSKAPTKSPSESPSESPSMTPSASPSSTPTNTPSASPTSEPTETPSAQPTDIPTMSPTAPSSAPTKSPEGAPTKEPTNQPSKEPTKGPTKGPTKAPHNSPSKSPSATPMASDPTTAPVESPTTSPVGENETGAPVGENETGAPVGVNPTFAPSAGPTDSGTQAPTNAGAERPTGPTPAPVGGNASVCSVSGIVVGIIVAVAGRQM